MKYLSPVILLSRHIKINHYRGISVVAQWIRIRLPPQEPQVQSLGQEDPIASGATKSHVPRLSSPNTAPAQDMGFHH